MAFFAGSYIEGSFFKAIFFPKIMDCPCLILSYFFDSTENINRTKTTPFVTFLLIFKVMGAF